MGLIPRLDLGGRAPHRSPASPSPGWVAFLGVADDLHAIALGYAIASLGFGLFRPGTTAGTSLAVTRAEQGQAGRAASVAPASSMPPLLGVWLYNQQSWLGFGLIVGICLAVFCLRSRRTLQRDSVLTAERI